MSHSRGWKRASCVIAIGRPACPCPPGRLVGTTGRCGFPVGMQAGVSPGATAPAPRHTEGSRPQADNWRWVGGGALRRSDVPSVRVSGTSCPPSTHTAATPRQAAARQAARDPAHVREPLGGLVRANASAERAISDTNVTSSQLGRRTRQTAPRQRCPLGVSRDTPAWRTLFQRPGGRERNEFPLEWVSVCLRPARIRANCFEQPFAVALRPGAACCTWPALRSWLFVCALTLRQSSVSSELRSR